ncbi:MAG: hypothetical protein ACOZB3_03875, partial [Calditrichota bacterium]
GRPCPRIRRAGSLTPPECNDLAAAGSQPARLTDAFVFPPPLGGKRYFPHIMGDEGSGDGQKKADRENPDPLSNAIVNRLVVEIVLQ